MFYHASVIKTLRTRTFWRDRFGAGVLAHGSFGAGCFGGNIYREV